MYNDISQRNPDEFLNLFGITQGDLDHVRQLGELLVVRLEEYADLFYEWVVCLPDYEVIFSNPEMKAHARAEQINYWRLFFNGVVDETYLDSRRLFGQAHTRSGLSLSSYLAGMNYSLVVLTETMGRGGPLPSAVYVDCLRAVNKLVLLDITVVSDTCTHAVNERIAQQGQALMEMSTPVTQIWQDILMLPMVGIIDSRRAQDVMMAVLTRISETRAKVFIMDISGVAVVDSAVANYLIKITKATGLMGCTSMVSGISPAIAQTMVNLGFDVKEITTSATLRDALEQAFRLIGRTVH
jgi:rsbT co-antagonist protein RsbR